jgi:hypothetical protein
MIRSKILKTLKFAKYFRIKTNPLNPYRPGGDRDGKEELRKFLRFLDKLNNKHIFQPTNLLFIIVINQTDPFVIVTVRTVKVYKNQNYSNLRVMPH